MMKNIVKFIPTTTIGVVYFFLCGASFQMGFWTTFDFDVSNLLSITEIPKSFIYPFMLTNIAFLLHLTYIDFVTQSFNKPNNQQVELNNENKPTKKWFNHPIFTLIFDQYLIFFFAASIAFYFYAPYSKIFWVSISFSFSLILSYRLRNSSLLRTISSSRIKLYLGYIICWFPIMAFMTGKIKSIQIHLGLEYHRISKIELSNNDMKSDDLIQAKLLGFIGDKVIIQPKDNPDIIVINQSSIEVLQLKLVKKEADSAIEDTSSVAAKKLENNPDSLCRHDKEKYPIKINKETDTATTRLKR